MSRYLILDCFVDEPACFGVPPFISPYPRYVYGALLDSGIPDSDIGYLTIDHLRDNEYKFDTPHDAVFLIGGAIVPGKYLGEKIGTYDEILRIIDRNRSHHIIIGGLAGHLLSSRDFRHVTTINHDIEQYARTFRTEPDDSFRSYNDLDRWAAAGSEVVTRHPDFPHIIAEIETYRGCPRENHCSFCSEKVFSSGDHRGVSGILEEVDALISRGVSRFRIGRQADILAYGTTRTEFRNGFPRPEPSAVEELFGELKKRKDDGRITTLNIDNANPGTIANYPDESARAITAIVGAVTPGDTMPLGIESFDPVVNKRNNLKVNRDKAIQVVRMINEIGGTRVNGIPLLLPGINLIHGLPGESAESFRLNYEALAEMRDAGLLIKRINIRTLSPFPGTDAAHTARHTDKRIENRYEFYREKIRDDIDRVMLERIYPVGTILRELRVSDTRFEYSLARAIQSYAITVKIPEPLKIGSYTDAVVVSHRERSIMALTIPIRINLIAPKTIEFIPGIGKRTAGDIILRRPLSEMSTLLEISPSLDSRIIPHITFGKDIHSV